MAVDEKWVKNLQGKEFVEYPGLLDLAHKNGLKGIQTTILQFPGTDNGGVCIVSATVDMGDGKTFSDIGDASPQNVNRMIAAHMIRMASTRAKARALRDAVNVGVTAFEELEVCGDPEAEKLKQQAAKKSPPPTAKPQQSPTDMAFTAALASARKVVANAKMVATDGALVDALNRLITNKAKAGGMSMPEVIAYVGTAITKQPELLFNLLPAKPAVAEAVKA